MIGFEIFGEDLDLRQAGCISCEQGSSQGQRHHDRAARWASEGDSYQVHGQVFLLYRQSVDE